jgi:hypothetical protein
LSYPGVKRAYVLTSRLLRTELHSNANAGKMQQKFSILKNQPISLTFAPEIARSLNSTNFNSATKAIRSKS